MKKIGIIGGMGPEATLDYYKGIINAFKYESGNLNYPEIILYSVNLSEIIGMMKQKKYEDLINYLSEKIDLLKRAGAEFAVFTANTPHLFFDRLKEKSPLPLISIVEATCAEALKRGLKRPGLFGTGITMDSSFYPDVFNKEGINVVMPDREDKEMIHEKIFTEIELGIFNDDTRHKLIEIMEKMVREQHIDSLILGCTELPLILEKPDYAGIPMLDTTKIHVKAIVKHCLDDNK